MGNDKTLVHLAVEYWKLLRALERAIDRLPHEHVAKTAAQVRFSAGRLDSLLKESGLKLIAFDGERFEPNIPATAVNVEDFVEGERLTIEFTVEPAVVENMTVLLLGKVVLKRIEDGGVMYLGIDFGTSNSVIAGNDGSELSLFKTVEGTDVLPSVIYIDKRGHKFVGVRDYDKAILSPENVAQGFKRLMGTSSPISFAAAALEMSPEECSAEIIRMLLGQAKSEIGDFNIRGTVITIPAAFNQMQSEATIRAANLAGLERVGLLHKPIAAAMASMADSKNRNGQFLVYDLGGGTFDVALVQSVGGSVNVVTHEGINMLGGRDFDRMLVNEFVRPWLLENFSLPDDFQTDSRYRRLVGIVPHAAENAKIALSSAGTAVVFAGDEEVRVRDVEGNDIYFSIDITQRDVDELIAGRSEESWLPHAESFVLPGATHFLQLEDPRATAEALAAFWSRHRLPAGVI